MYIPKPFNVTDEREIFDFIDQNAFGQLISRVGNRLFSTHMPFLLSQDNRTVYAHVALQNPQHQSIDGQEVLLTFQGAHDYISPSWYQSPGVPTWNYQAVHVYGRAKTFSSTKKLRWLVDTLTDRYESDLEMPWGADYNEKMLQAIVGIEISIDDVEAKFKLSQNRAEQDQLRVIEHLEARGATDLVKAMNRNKEIK